jgi:hypothetical protein
VALCVPLAALGEEDAGAAGKRWSASRETASRTVEDGGTGPFPAVMTSDESLPTHTIFRPKDLAPFGEENRLPIMVWGNGACANSPWEHVNFLSEVASHGFLVIAIGLMPAEGQRGAPGGPTKSDLLFDAMEHRRVEHLSWQTRHQPDRRGRDVLRRIAGAGSGS